jgi:hypothetical protein
MCEIVVIEDQNLIPDPEEPVIEGWMTPISSINQPERSKREDVVDNGPFFPPPWSISEYPEKTEGWIEFQRAMKKDPKYYLNDAVL